MPRWNPKQPKLGQTPPKKATQPPKNSKPPKSGTGDGKGR